MSVSSDFESLLENLKIKNSETISSRYDSITRRLNIFYRNHENKKSNSFQAGSYGRHTGIHGISDLDMLYILPDSRWDQYKNNPRLAIQHCLNEIKNTYPRTSIKLDRNVVVVETNDLTIEVVPVFNQENGCFKYPDTYEGGSWKTCNPRAEKEAFRTKNIDKNKNLRRLCKIVRAWKKRNSIIMSGFLIDTLCYRFFESNHSYNSTSFSSYHLMISDFFDFLANEPPKTYYRAMGSNSHVYVKKPFKKVALEAYKKCIEAEESRNSSQYNKCNKLYKSLFGTFFPNNVKGAQKKGAEQFIEDYYPVAITKSIALDCEIKEDNITKLLSGFIARINHQRTLNFFIKKNDIEGDFSVKWKVLNQGPIAERDNSQRGQIIDDDGTKTRTETSTFFGNHIVECYAIQNNHVIAKDMILVPIA
ncbi:hypothetical protein KDX00_08030 [Cobetia amphilecti]|nr:hypothetical protein KDX00_08030 [Cobetia litoralis]